MQNACKQTQTHAMVAYNTVACLIMCTHSKPATLFFSCLSACVNLSACLHLATMLGCHSVPAGWLMVLRDL